MRRTSLRYQFCVLCATVVVLFCVQPAWAARLLQVHIEQDGKVVAHTYYQDGGRAEAPTVWRYLQRPPLMVDDDVTRIEPAADEPLRVRLVGDLTIRIQHADRVIAEAKLSALILRRLDERTQGWFLPGSEVERTAEIAGLGPPEPAGWGLMAVVGLPVLVVLATLMLAGIVISIRFLRSRRPRPTAENGT